MPVLPKEDENNEEKKIEISRQGSLSCALNNTNGKTLDGCQKLFVGKVLPQVSRILD